LQPLRAEDQDGRAGGVKQSGDRIEREHVQTAGRMKRQRKNQNALQKRRKR
jgi:hypothetical protein